MPDEKTKQRLIREHAHQHRCWRTRRGLAYLGLAWRKLLRDLSTDVWEKAPGILPKPKQSTANDQAGAGPQRPLIFASYAVDELHPGSHRYCGGEKLLNNLVLQLRRKGFDAWMVTLDGKQAGWLMEQAPCLSLEEFRGKKNSAKEVRCVTSWIDARAFLAECQSFYYWDMELATSSDYQFPRIAKAMRRGRIRNLSAFNRAIQAWFMEVFDRPCGLLRTLVDEKYWHPDEAKRVPNRVGYMDEGPHTAALIEQTRAQCKAAGLQIDFVELRGDEPAIRDGMQSCEVFLVTNPGKSPIWGEGGPMTPHEAMACGTVPVCFDLNGPRESVIDGYCGRIVVKGNNTAYASAVAELFQDRNNLRQMSTRAAEIIQESHTMEKRWPEIATFLNLEGIAPSMP